MSKGTGRDVSMIIKITGIDPSAITFLHERVEKMALEKTNITSRFNIQQIRPVSILSCKLDSAYHTYTIELQVIVKMGNAVSRSDDSKDKPRFGEYFISEQVLHDIFNALSIGQKIPFFPNENLLVGSE